MSQLVDAGGVLFLGTAPLETGPLYLSSGDQLPQLVVAPPFDGDFQAVPPKLLTVSRPPDWAINDPGDLPLIIPPGTGGGLLFLNNVPLETGPQYRWSGNEVQQTAAIPPISAEEWQLARPVLFERNWVEPWLLDPGDLPLRYAIDGGGGVIAWGGVQDETTTVEPGSFDNAEVPIAQAPMPFDLWDDQTNIGRKAPSEPVVPRPEWWNDAVPTPPTAPPDDLSWFVASPVPFTRDLLEQIMRAWGDERVVPPTIFEPDADILGMLRAPVARPVERIPNWIVPGDDWWPQVFISPAVPLPTSLGIELIPNELTITGNIATQLGFIGQDGFVMATPVIFTVNETGPLTLLCSGADGSVENLATAASVTLRLVNKHTGAIPVNAVALTNRTSSGTGVWTRQAAEVATAGDYSAQVTVIRADGTLARFPDAQRGQPVTLLKAV